MSAMQPIKRSDLDPLALDLGLAAGVLSSDGSDQVTVNQAWFNDPLGNSAKGLRTNGQDLAALLAAIFGQVEGNALAIPSDDPAGLGTWYPIGKPGAKPGDPPTGLYIVTYAQGAEQVFGLGVKHVWGFGSGNNGSAIEVTAFGILPVLRAGPAEANDIGAMLVLGSKDNPMMIGIAASSPSGPIISGAGLSLGGGRLSVQISFDPKQPVTVSLEILQLQLPGDAKPADRSLADLETITSQQLLSTVAALLVTGLTKLTGEDQRTQYLMPLFGLIASVPGVDDVQLPLLDWISLATQAKQNDLAKPFRDWFNALASEPANLKAWLGCVTGLLCAPGTLVTGTGTRDDPFAAPIVTVGASGALSLTMASLVGADGARVVYPGLGVSSPNFVIGSDIAVALTAALELFQFTLTANGSSAVSSLRFDAAMKLLNNTAGQPLFNGGGYNIGYLTAGLELTSDLAVIPSFLLVDVQTPQGQFASLDLTAPNTLADVAEQALLAAIDAALQKLLGIDPNSPQAVPFASAVAALVGFVPPTNLPNGVTWPSTELPPPFSAAQLPSSLQNPIAALGSYWSQLLQSGVQVGGKLPFFYMLGELAGMLQAAVAKEDPVAVTGDGTRASPWLAALSTSALPAYLSAYVEPGNAGAQVLTIGLRVAPSITVGGTAIDFAAGFDIVALAFPAGQPAVDAQWLPQVSAALTLPNGGTTPAVLGAAFKVSSAAISAGWSRSAGWGWSILAQQPAVVIDGTEIPLGQDLNFSDPAALQKLVTESGAIFAPILLGALGIALSRTGTRAGTAATALFGLLPNLSGKLPDGLEWPADMPHLTITSLSNPLPDLTKQLAGLIDTADHAKAALTILAWAMIPSSQTPPVLTGSGTSDDPFQIPAAGLGPWSVSAWIDPPQTGLGFGLIYQQDAKIGAVEVTTTVRLDVAELSFAGNAATFLPVMPALSLRVEVQEPGALLVNRPDLGVVLTSASFVLKLTLTSGGAETTSWKLDLVAPNNADSVSRSGSAGAPDVTGQTYAELALALALEAAATALADNQTFQSVYTLLTVAGLAVPVKDKTGYGLNVGGWRSFIADPTGSLASATQSLLTDATNRDAFFGLIWQILGMPPFQVPPPVLVTMQALGIVQGPDQGYALIPAAAMALVRSPFATVRARFQELTQDADALRALIGQFGDNQVVARFWILQFEVANSSRVSLSFAPGKTLSIANLLAVDGEIALDLQTFRLEATTAVGVPQVGLSIVSTLSLASATQPPQPNDLTASFNIGVAWGSANLPAPPALPIYPFSSNTFLNALADVAPQYVLSTFVTGFLQSDLLANYPLAQAFFKGLGVAFTDANGQLQMPSLLGLLTDPIGWFEGIGLFQLSTLQSVLTSLPDTSGAGGLSLQTITNGKRVAGLPYGLQIDLTVDLTANLATLTPNLGTPFSIAQGVATLDKLALGLGLDATFQPSISGELRVGGTVPGNTKIFAELGYQKSFTLAVGEDSEGGAVFQLVPFPSWTTLVLQLAAKAEQAVLREVTNLLLQELAKDESLAPFVANLRQSATDLDVPGLVNGIIAVQTDPSRIEEVALKWLRERIDSTNVAKTSKSIADLLGSLVSGFSSKDGLVVYDPGNSLPVIISAGLYGPNGNQVLGLWADLNYTAASILQFGIKHTGVAIPIAGQVVPTVTFDAGLCALIEGTSGPTLSLRFDSGTGAIQMSVDPLGGGSELERELLPQLFGVPPNQLPQEIEKWLLQVLLLVVPRYLIDAVLLVSEVNDWMHRGIVPQQQNGETTYAGPKPGEVLSAAHILVTVETPSERYVLNSLDKLKQLTIAQFLSGFFIALLQNELQLLKVDKGGIWIAKPKPVGDISAYGLRVALPDLNIPGLDNLIFQLGATDTAWIKEAGGDPDTLEPGVSFLVPIDPNNGPNFAQPILDIINVGVDIVGSKGKPLVDLSRFQLGALQPRGLVEFTFGQSKLVPIFGGALTIENIAISLAPNTVTGGGNQVAQNLLGSGTDSNQANPPTNPSFSALAGYLSQPSGQKLAVDLIGPDGTSQTKIWIPVQRSFGPLHVNQVGFGWLKSDYRALVLFDGSLSLFGFTGAVQDLEVGIPVTDITNYNAYTLDLGGLEISYNGGGLTIAGGLLKEVDPDTQQISYSGAASVQAGKYGVTAIGSYTMIATSSDPNASKAPSLFVFGVLRGPLGGPPAFFITGAAGGFAYNRDLVVPPVSEITDFPFIKGARDPSFFGNNDPGKALATLGPAAPPKVGSYWAAVGLSVTTFKLVETFALAMVQFGGDFAINIVGVSTISQPPLVERDQALVYLELAMKISLRPSDGVFSMEAQLTPNSFVLIQACKVTGGFAFYLWFKDDPEKKISAGDFVLTVGGYSPRFTKPDFYPTVPIVGINWPVTDGVNVRGGAYLALTSSAFMAGGYLNATFEAGPIEAWFDASMDVLIAWQPFYFYANINISVGVAFDVEVAGVHMRLSASLGAGLLLEGPPVHGHVTVSWYVISFTIPFGDGPNPDDQTLTWGDFEAAFLPPPQKPQLDLPQHNAASLAAADPAPLQQVVKAASQVALLAKTVDAQGEDWTVPTAPLSVRLESAIPMTLATITTGSPFQGVDIGVPPVGLTSVGTPMEVTLEYKDSGGNYQTVTLSDTGVGFSDGRSGAPDAMWSKQLFDPEATPSAKVIPNSLTSLVMAGDEYVVGTEIGPIDLLHAFAFSDGPKLPLAFDQMPVYTPAQPMQQGTFEQIMQRIGSTIMARPVVTTRNAIYAALTDAGIYTPQDPNLSVMATFTATLFQAPPTLAALSETLSPTTSGFGQRVATAPTPKKVAAAPTAGGATEELRLVASLSRYRRPPRPRASGVAATEAAAAPRPAKLYIDLTRRRRSRLAQAQAGAQKIRLYDGSYEHWQVPSTSAATIAAQGEVPLRAIAFNVYHELLDDRIVPGSGSSVLPKGTADLILQHAGQLAADTASLVGWTRRTQLLQANRAQFVGDGFTVKPHGDPRLRRRGRIQRRGTMDGATMLRRNTTRQGPGWVETTFFGAMRSLIVTVRGTDAAAAAAATDVQLRLPRAAYRKLTPVATIASAGAILLVYGLSKRTGLHRVLVRCSPGLVLEGCHAWSGTPAKVKGVLPGLQPLVGGMVLGETPTQAVATLSVEPSTSVKTGAP
jgi:hypothetical protein